jgi:hypothetical protein
MACAALSSASAQAPPPAIEVQTGDVDRFYRLYDATAGRPTAEQLQREYLDPGSPGLRHLLAVRNVNAENIAKATATNPDLYLKARTCLAALPRVRDRLDQVFGRLVELYPQAQRPPVTILVSRGKPMAIAGPGDGVQISLEAICSGPGATFFDADIDDRLVHVMAHEYIHVQQAKALADKAEPTVLERALIEGVAEFVGEVISGGVANTAVFASVKGRELEIETRFAADIDKTDLSAWFDNTTADDVGQLGYWVGYRIARASYLNASDKPAALRRMMQLTDARAFLAASGWRPGVDLG